MRSFHSGLHLTDNFPAAAQVLKRRRYLSGTRFTACARTNAALRCLSRQPLVFVFVRFFCGICFSSFLPCPRLKRYQVGSRLRLLVGDNKCLVLDLRPGGAVSGASAVVEDDSKTEVTHHSESCFGFIVFFVLGHTAVC